MQTTDFDYELPAGLIAQQPANPRDSCRLMLLNRTSGEIDHLQFRDLPDLLEPRDTLALNQSRVIPARLQASKRPGGGRVELLLLNRRRPAVWEAMVGGKGLHPGRQVEVVGGPTAEVLEDLGGSTRLIRFESPISATLEEIGSPPVPPYINRPLDSPEDYQTVYAREPGSAAAPTAGLHFTDEQLNRIREQGTRVATITLHIGLDTFAPVTDEHPSDHPIHSEWCSVPDETVLAVRTTRQSAGRVVAVGTTTVRALETAAQNAGEQEALLPFEGPTDLFILPGYSFRVVDTMLTNFHLPRSTLLMMVSAFAGREHILRAYSIAVEQGYRFYSFGDAMLII